MKFLKQHIHLIAFWILTIAFLKLQFSTDRFGWPFCVTRERFTSLGAVWFASMFNFVYAIFIIGIAMAPFRDGIKPIFKIYNLIMFVLAGSIAIRLLTIDMYIHSFGLPEQMIIIFLATMTSFGVLCQAVDWTSKFSERPDPQKNLRTPEQHDDTRLS